MTEVRELAIELREIADAGHEVSGAADTMRQAASAIEALSAQVEELRGALKDAEAVSTATIEYFLKRGDKEVAAYHIRHRSRVQSALSLEAGKE